MKLFFIFLFFSPSLVFSSGILLSLDFNQCDCLYNSQVSNTGSSSSEVSSISLTSLTTSCSSSINYGPASIKGITSDPSLTTSPTYAIQTPILPSLTFEPAFGVTFEHWIRFGDLLLGGDVILSEHRSTSQTGNALPNFLCGMQIKPLKPLQLIIFYASIQLLSFDEFQFDISSFNFQSDDAAHVVCGFRVDAGGLIKPFACLNGDCQQENGYTASAQTFQPDSFIGLGFSQSFLPASTSVKFDIISFKFYNGALSESDVLANSLDDSVLQSYPALNQLINFSFVEDDPTPVTVFPDLDFIGGASPASANKILVSSPISGVLSPAAQEFTVDNADSVQYTSGSNFYTTIKNSCDALIATASDFVGIFDVSIVIDADRSCQLPSVSVRGCGVETNDKPVAQSKTANVVDSTSPVVLQFIPGTDVDDNILNGQTPDGILSGGHIVLHLSSLLGTLIRNDSPTACAGDEITDGESVQIVDKKVSICYLRGPSLAPSSTPNSVGKDSLQYSLFDKAGLEADSEATLTIEVQNLLSVCADAGGSCEDQTTENEGKLLTLIGKNLLNETLTYKIKSIPLHGRLYRDASLTQQLISGSTLAAGIEQVFYLPNDGYFNLNEALGSIDGLGNSLCQAAAPCPDTFQFSVNFQNSEKSGFFSIGVVSIDNFVTVILCPNSIQIEEGAATDVTACEVDPFEDGDVYEIDLGVEPSVDISVQLADVTTIPGVDYATLPSGCGASNFCSEKVVLRGYPSAINSALAGMAVKGSRDGSISFTLTDGAGTSDELTMVVFQAKSPQEKLVPILAGVAGVIGVFVVGNVFYRFRRHSASEKDDDDLKDILEAKKKGPQMPADEPPPQMKRFKPKPPSLKQNGTEVSKVIV